MPEQATFDFRPAEAAKPPELRKRDEALNTLAKTRAELVAAAKAAAMKIWRRQGEVTSPQVIAEMKRSRVLASKIDSVDKRFMGVVFRSGNGWRRLRFDPCGSHNQPISVWTRFDD